MPFVEQPDGYLPHPNNIYACCWSCGASRRDIVAADGTVRRERIFAIDRFIPADEHGAVVFIGMGPAGILALCETCLTGVAAQLGLIPAEVYTHLTADAAAAPHLRQMVAQVEADRESWRVRSEQLADELSWMTSARDEADTRFRLLSSLDADNAESVVGLREQIETKDRLLANLQAQVESRDVAIDALRRGQEPPPVRRGPGRPRLNTAS